MCIIAYLPAGSATLTDDKIRTMWTHNPDGAGYAFALNGEMILRKPFWHLRDLLKAYKEDHTAHGAVAPFVVHLRVATHGGKTEQNTHPHIVGRGRAVVAHNGIIRCAIPDPTMSDTVAFCASQLARVRMHKLVAQPMRDDLSRKIGPENKLVILAADGTVSIVNERMGRWIDGAWFSNSYSLESWSGGGWTPARGYGFKGARKPRHDAATSAQRYYSPRAYTEWDSVADAEMGLDTMRRQIAHILGCTPAELTDAEETMIERAAMDLSNDPENVAAILSYLEEDVINGFCDDMEDEGISASDGLQLTAAWTDAQGREWEEYMDAHGRLSVRRIF